MQIEIYQIIIAIYILINLWASIIMFIDKRRAVYRLGRRIPEGLMFFYAAIFGSLGIFLGMHIFRHKTRKWYFNAGLPILFIQNILFIYFIYKSLCNYALTL